MLRRDARAGGGGQRCVKLLQPAGTGGCSRRLGHPSFFPQEAIGNDCESFFMQMHIFTSRYVASEIKQQNSLEREKITCKEEGMK